jgi:hypothetical protein
MVSDHEQQFSSEDRAARVAAVRAAIGEEGTVVSFEPTHQPITLDLPRMRELDLRPEFMRSAAAGMTPEASAREVLRYLHGVMGENGGRTLLDLGLRRRLRRGEGSGLDLYLSAIESAATAEFGPVQGADSRFPVVVVR